MSQLVAKIAREKNWPFPLIENVEDFVDCTVYSTTFSSLSLEFAQTNVRCRFKQIFLLCCKNDFQMQLTMHSPPPSQQGVDSSMNCFTSSFCSPLHTFANLLSAYLTRHLSGYHSTLAALGCHGIVFIFKKVFFANMKEIMKIILRMFIV